STPVAREDGSDQQEKALNSLTEINGELTQCRRLLEKLKTSGAKQEKVNAISRLINNIAKNVLLLETSLKTSAITHSQRELAAPTDQSKEECNVQTELRQMDREASALYEKGDQYEAERRYEEAFQCYQEAANQGHAEAQYLLGTKYYYGTRVATDQVQAHE